MTLSEGEHKCESCGLSFASEEELERRLQEHLRAAEILRCEKCKATFGSREELEAHMREIHQG
jgi:uncharacterized protein with PIN domain